MDKIKAYGVRQYIIGRGTEVYYFASRSERQKYIDNHNYCDLMRCKSVRSDMVYDTYNDWLIDWYNGLV